MVATKRIAVVHVARRTLGMDDATYRRVLQERGGVDSAKDLDDEGFAAVMEYFTACGFRSTWTKRTFGPERPGRASPRQIEMIKGLWQRYSGSDDTNALDRWIESSYGVTSLRFATQEIASKAINGLKAMVRRTEGAGKPHKRRA